MKHLLTIIVVLLLASSTTAQGNNSEISDDDWDAFFEHEAKITEEHYEAIPEKIREARDRIRDLQRNKKLPAERKREQLDNARAWYEELKERKTKIEQGTYFVMPNILFSKEVGAIGVIDPKQKFPHGGEYIHKTSLNDHSSIYKLIYFVREGNYVVSKESGFIWIANKHRKSETVKGTYPSTDGLFIVSPGEEYASVHAIRYDAIPTAIKELNTLRAEWKKRTEESE
jgi:hypothetical protein